MGRSSASCRHRRSPGAGGPPAGLGAFADGRSCRVSTVARLDEAQVQRHLLQRMGRCRSHRPVGRAAADRLPGTRLRRLLAAHVGRRRGDRLGHRRHRPGPVRPRRRDGGGRGSGRNIHRSSRRAHLPQRLRRLLEWSPPPPHRGPAHRPSEAFDDSGPYAGRQLTNADWVPKRLEPAAPHRGANRQTPTATR